MKKRIILSESQLTRIIRNIVVESVNRKMNNRKLTEGRMNGMIKKSLHETLNKKYNRQKRAINESILERDEIMFLKQNGLDPRMVEKLLEPTQIPVYNDEVEGQYEWTDDFGIMIEPQENYIRLWVNGYTDENDDAISAIENMCFDIKDGTEPEDVWRLFTYYNSL